MPDPKIPDSANDATQASLASPSCLAWERRFCSRYELCDDDVLRKCDCVWMYGDWRPINDSHVGMEVRSMAFIYGVDPRPTFGRRGLKSNGQSDGDTGAIALLRCLPTCELEAAYRLAKADETDKGQHSASLIGRELIRRASPPNAADQRPAAKKL